MTELSDRAMARLRQVVDHPETTDGRYAVREQIGRGGMGVVFRAHDMRLDRDVALKVLHPDADAPSGGDRLVREAQILARLDHPGIVTVHDTGRLMDGRVYYVMRLVRGTRLDVHAASGVGRGDLLRIVLRLCETVAFAHEQGIVHRDLKPGNVMIGPFGEVLVLDWGVAKVIAADRKGSAGSVSSLETAGTAIFADSSDYADTAQRGIHPLRDENSAAVSSVTADGAVIGTSGYMAPEQAAGESARVDGRADVFGLGVILRELVAMGDAPVPRALRAIVERATAALASDRYPSATALADDVRHWLDGEAVSAHRERALERAARFYRRHEVAVLLLLAYVVVRTIIVFWRRF